MRRRLEGVWVWGGGDRGFGGPVERALGRMSNVYMMGGHWVV